MGGRGRGLGSALRGGPVVSGGQRRTGLSEAARKQIADAHQAADAGAHADAAEQFAVTAARMSERGEHAVALHLQIEAARARKAAGDADGAAAAAGEAIGYASQAQSRPKAVRKLGQLVQDLRTAGHTDAADRIEADAKARLDVKKLSAPEAAAPTINRAMRRALPKACPACGARVKAEAIEFSDDGIADCGRCGSTLTG